MTTKREGFFGTDNLHRAGWAALIGLAGFLGALTYHKVFGLQKVVVETIVTPGPPAQITTESTLRSKDISDLAESIQKLANATSKNVEQKRLRELSDEVDRLRSEVARSRKPSSPVPQSSSKNSPAGDAARNEIPTNTPTKFVLPETAKGYTSAKLFGVSATTCPPRDIAPGISLRMTFDLNDLSLISRATPVRTMIVQVRTPTDLLQIDEAWSDLQPGANTVTLGPKLEPGNYKLIYGFYLRGKLSSDFPEFYSRACSFVVRST